MRIRKYDFNYGRRKLMEKVAIGAGAGVLAPLWPLIGKGADLSKAYPDELLSIDAYTKGKVKPGDILTENNVDYVKDLLDPICYKQVKEMGRTIRIKEATTDISEMYNHVYLELTRKNAGRAKFGPDGNLWTDGQVGKAWIGGMPFPDAKTGLEAFANIATSWGRHDYSQYPIPTWCVGPSGNLEFRYDFLWAELQVTGRNDGAVFHNMKDLLRIYTALFTFPASANGTSFLNDWYYDQHKFPALYGYLPAFRRTRQYPTNQRFEPLLPGMSFWLSDAWGAGDPMLTWGNFKVLGRKPILGACSSANWYAGKDPKWHAPFVGGPKGKTFFETTFELIPEALVWDAAPTGYPRAPIGIRRTWSDVRNGTMITQINYDRRGAIWKQTEFGKSQLKNDKFEIKDPHGNPEWSWNYAQFHDIQSNRITLIRLASEMTGGIKCVFDPPDFDHYYNKFLTMQAIQTLGQV